MCKFFSKGLEQPSPSDIVAQDSLEVQYHADKRISVLILLDQLNIPFTKEPRVWISPIPDTGSMDPVFDHEHNNIYIQGLDAANQAILVSWLFDEWWNKKRANIIIYQLPGSNPVVHRLLKIDIDGQGRKWWFKGDNNRSKDPVPARDENIKWLMIATIY